MIVRVIFISAFFFYCLLLNHSFPTNPNRIILTALKLVLSLYYKLYKLHLLKCVRLFFDFLNTALRGMFDKCASCAEAWERVVCALACSPKQNSFVSHGVHFDPRGHINNVTYQLYIQTSLGAFKIKKLKM